MSVRHTWGGQVVMEGGYCKGAEAAKETETTLQY
jgi:hypothetical protein